MLDLQEKREQGYFELLPKKEGTKLGEKLTKLEKYFQGIGSMEKIPDALFVVDIGKEDICIAEAQKLGVKIFAIVDTDCDPNKVQHIVPGNDDAVRAIKLITAKMADAVIAGTNILNSNQATDSINEEDFEVPQQEVSVPEVVDTTPTAVAEAVETPSAETPVAEAVEQPVSSEAEENNGTEVTSETTEEMTSETTEE